VARTIAKDHDEKRINILRTAAQVFAREGFARASMSLLAQECGISKANIYHYYDSKNALLFDILNTYLSDLRDRICGLPMEGLSPEEKLRTTVSETLLAYEGMDAEHAIQPEGVQLLPVEQQNILRGYQRDLVTFMSSILTEIAPGVFNGDKSKLRNATMSVFGMLNWFYMWNKSATAEAREDYADLVASLTIGGIRAL